MIKNGGYMLFNKIMGLTKNVFERSSTYLAIGRDIYDYSKNSIKEHLEKGSSQKDIETQLKRPEALEEQEKKREYLRKQMEVLEAENPFVEARQQSMQDSQGVADHSGSSYHGPGKPGEKSNANMWQRNFDNHQGN
jgi:hypothetical protein